MAARGWARGLRLAGPSLACLAAVVVEFVPLRLPGAIVMAPNWALFAVFVLALLRHELVPPWAVFLVGLVKDILAGLPLGLNALVLMLVREAARLLEEPLRGQPFIFTWFCFSIVALAAQLCTVLLTIALTGALIAAAPATAAFAITVFAFPMAYLALRRVSQAMLAGL
jgi:rod shape-determining protein MreD